MSSVAMNANAPVRLGYTIACAEAGWQTANRDIAWLWKRDCGPLQRMICFTGSLDRDQDTSEAILKRWSFFYRHRAPRKDVAALYELLDCESVRELIGAPVHGAGAGDLATVELRSRSVDEATAHIIARLKSRRPRRSLPQGDFPEPVSRPFDVRCAAPVVVYAGSGLSYEAGLQTLADVHRDFGVDDIDSGRLTFGLHDPIPAMLRESATRTFLRFARFHIEAALAKPSPSHEAIGSLYGRGIVRAVLSDNVDNLFERCGVPCTRTRTIFPQAHSYEFDARDRTLLVVGIAADRRGLIAKARRQGMAVVVVNPFRPVSPQAQNLSYLRRRDTWYRMSAHTFFTRCISYGSRRQRNAPTLNEPDHPAPP